jgi:hypothetical protein
VDVEVSHNVGLICVNEDDVWLHNGYRFQDHIKGRDEYFSEAILLNMLLKQSGKMKEHTLMLWPRRGRHEEFSFIVADDSATIRPIR